MRLSHWTRTISDVPLRQMTSIKWLLLVLDTAANTTKVEPFETVKSARAALRQVERSGNANLDAVLVWVGSIRNLKRAYPNYFSDTSEFLKKLERAMR